MSKEGDYQKFVYFIFFLLILSDTKAVGPLLSSPAKPLPDDLQQFVMGSGDEGVILVSFGSILSDRRSDN